MAAPILQGPLADPWARPREMWVEGCCHLLRSPSTTPGRFWVSIHAAVVGGTFQQSLECAYPALFVLRTLPAWSSFVSITG